MVRDPESLVREDLSIPPPTVARRSPADDEMEIAKTVQAALTSRVLVLELDSVRQAERFRAAESPQQAIREITGMIRMALLVSEHILITDSMLIDGVYFAHMPPEDLAAALGVHSADLPMTVLTAASTLEGAVRSKRRDRAFRWQVEPELRKAHWAAWTALGPRLTLEPQGRLAPFTDPSPEWVAQLSPAARAHLAAARALTSRSLFYALSDAAQRAHPNDPGIREIRLWWDTAYLIAIADGNRANWLRFDEPHGERDGLDSRAAQGRRRVHLAAHVTKTATEVTPPVFGTIRYTTRTQRAAVLEKPTGYRMRSLSYAIQKSVTTHSRTRAFISAALRVVLAGLAIVAALPLLPDVLNGWNVAWLVFAAAAIASLPYDAIGTIFEAGRREEAILSVRVDRSDGAAPR